MAYGAFRSCPTHRVVVFVTQHFSKMRASTSTSSNGTIFALSSGSPPCAISIIRISGENAKKTLFRMTRANEDTKLASFRPTARRLFYTDIIHPQTNELLDTAMAVWLPGPWTHTGEDTCELHVHGGVAVLQDVLHAVGSLPDNRFALPGEFTKRAFLNGKLDLTAVEAFKDLITAETSAQRKLALRQTSGELAKHYHGWRHRLLTSLAHCESFIDFSEEELIPHDLLTTVVRDVDALKRTMRRHLLASRAAERVRRGVRVVIAGRPNVGKSTLFNALCERPAAIVTAQPGTTRDALDTHIDIRGFALMLTDTAGLRQTCDPVESIGVRRARQRMNAADVIVLVVDGSKLSVAETVQELQDCIVDELEYCIDSSVLTHENRDVAVCVLVNKVDLWCRTTRNRLSPFASSITWRHFVDIPVHFVSCETKLNFDVFVDCLGDVTEKLCASSLTGAVQFSRVRHRQLIERAVSSLAHFEDDLSRDVAVAAERIRIAAKAIGEIVGVISVEHVLDKIFSDFCIGK